MTIYLVVSLRQSSITDRLRDLFDLMPIYLRHLYHIHDEYEISHTQLKMIEILREFFMQYELPGKLMRKGIRFIDHLSIVCEIG